MTKSKFTMRYICIKMLVLTLMNSTQDTLCLPFQQKVVNLVSQSEADFHIPRKFRIHKSSINAILSFAPTLVMYLCHEWLARINQDALHYALSPLSPIPYPQELSEKWLHCLNSMVEQNQTNYWNSQSSRSTICIVPDQQLSNSSII